MQKQLEIMAGQMATKEAAMKQSLADIESKAKIDKERLHSEAAALNERISLLSNQLAQAAKKSEENDSAIVGFQEKTSTLSSQLAHANAVR